MKKFFKQLFCRHEWEEKTYMEVTQDFEGEFKFLKETRYRICKKCCKKYIKNESYWTGSRH